MNTSKHPSHSKDPPQIDDCLCPICLEILIEPVTMPCKHELCMPCFQQNVDEANLSCPMCRLRISNWARTAARTKTLIDQARWRTIRKYFSKQVAARMSGHADYESVTVPPVHEVCHIVAEPGEIRREYEAEIRKFEEQMKLEKEQEEAASKALIEKLQEFDVAELQVEESDEFIAHRLEEAESDIETNAFVQHLRDNLNERTKAYSVYDRVVAESTSTIHLLDRNSTRTTRTATPEPTARAEYEPETKPETENRSSRASTISGHSCTERSSSNENELSIYVKLEPSLADSIAELSADEQDQKEVAEDEDPEDSRILSSFCTPSQQQVDQSDTSFTEDSTDEAATRTPASCTVARNADLAENEISETSISPLSTGVMLRSIDSLPLSLTSISVGTEVSMPHTGVSYHDKKPHGKRLRFIRDQSDSTATKSDQSKTSCRFSTHSERRLRNTARRQTLRSTSASTAASCSHQTVSSRIETRSDKSHSSKSRSSPDSTKKTLIGFKLRDNQYDKLELTTESCLRKGALLRNYQHKKPHWKRLLFIRDQSDSTSTKNGQSKTSCPSFTHSERLTRNIARRQTLGSASASTSASCSLKTISSRIETRSNKSHSSASRSSPDSTKRTFIPFNSRDSKYDQSELATESPLQKRRAPLRNNQPKKSRPTRLPRDQSDSTAIKSDQSKASCHFPTHSERRPRNIARRQTLGSASASTAASCSHESISSRIETRSNKSHSSESKLSPDSTERAFILFKSRDSRYGQSEVATESPLQKRRAPLRNNQPKKIHPTRLPHDKSDSTATKNDQSKTSCRFPTHSERRPRNISRRQMLRSASASTAASCSHETISSRIETRSNKSHSSKSRSSPDSTQRAFIRFKSRDSKYDQSELLTTERPLRKRRK